MCGRYITTAGGVRDLFRYPEWPDFPPRYNIAPSQPVMVRLAEGGRHFALMRWGCCRPG